MSLTRVVPVSLKQIEDALTIMWLSMNLITDKELKRRLCVDHDHKTGEIRSLLCVFCNRYVVGRHRTPDLLAAAAKYLEGPFTGWFVPVKKKKRRRRRHVKEIRID